MSGMSGIGMYGMSGNDVFVDVVVDDVDVVVDWSTGRRLIVNNPFWPSNSIQFKFDFFPELMSMPSPPGPSMRSRPSRARVPALNLEDK